jgi:hypothetical protein
LPLPIQALIKCFEYQFFDQGMGIKEPLYDPFDYDGEQLEKEQAMEPLK